MATRDSTPRLLQELQNKSLSQYANQLSQYGFKSIENIVCLPQSEDSTLLNDLIPLNTNNKNRIKLATLLNEIRRKCDSQTTNININHTIDTIDLISPSPQPCKLEPKQEIENNQNLLYSDTSNASPNVSNQQIYRETMAEYGTESDYFQGQKVRFFNPKLAENGAFILRIGIVIRKVCVSDSIYDILDTQDNQIYSNVPWRLICKFGLNLSLNTSTNPISAISDISNNLSIADIADFANHNIFPTLETPIPMSFNTFNNYSQSEHSQITQEMAASNWQNHIQWREWECEFLLKANSDGRYISDDFEKFINISHGLSALTEKMRDESEAMPPWRTTKAVQRKIQTLLNECNGSSDENTESELEPIESASSSIQNSMFWREWELDKMKESYNKCERNASATEKAIEVSHALKEYTEDRRTESDYPSPWRTTAAVARQIILWKNEAKKSKKRKRKPVSLRRQFEESEESEQSSDGYSEYSYSDDSEALVNKKRRLC